ncbi:MAG: GntR family transcriptional regulator [Spirochaetes bacterium]|nr:GntR family transcriptional regulator [Spirochaetota bacterium]
MSTELFKYREVKYRLAAEWRASRRGAHAPVPGERSLARRFAVSADTVRKALAELLEEGVIYRVERRGTFLSPPARIRQVLVVAEEPAHWHPLDNSLTHFLFGMNRAVRRREQQVIPVFLDAESFLAQLPDLGLIYPGLAGVLLYRDIGLVLRARAQLEVKQVPFLFYGSDAHLGSLDGVNRHLFAESTLVDLALGRLRRRGVEEWVLLTMAKIPVLRRRGEAARAWLLERGVAASSIRVLPLDPQATFLKRRHADPRLGKLLGRLGPSSGVLAASDKFALPLINAAALGGLRLPQAFALVGIDHYPAAGEGPFRLTSVEIPFAADGARCFLALLRWKADGKPVDSRSRPRLRPGETA